MPAVQPVARAPPESATRPRQVVEVPTHRRRRARRAGPAMAWPPGFLPPRRRPSRVMAATGAIDRLPSARTRGRRAWSTRSPPGRTTAPRRQVTSGGATSDGTAAVGDLVVANSRRAFTSDFSGRWLASRIIHCSGWDLLTCFPGREADERQLRHHRPPRHHRSGNPRPGAGSAQPRRWSIAVVRTTTMLHRRGQRACRDAIRCITGTTRPAGRLCADYRHERMPVVGD